MTSTKNIQSLERAFGILEYINTSATGALSLAELSARTGLKPTTAFGLINTMVNMGYLQQDKTTKKYSISLKMLSFASFTSGRDALIHVIHPYIKEIAEKYCATSHAAMPQGDAIVYIDKYESQNSSVILKTRIGLPNYYHCTGVGKCILAYMPQDRREEVLSGELPANTPNTITDPDKLRKMLENVKINGYATETEEYNIGLSCVAVPIFSGPGNVPCAISLSSITPDTKKALEDGLIDDLKHYAAIISKEAYNFTY